MKTARMNKERNQEQRAKSRRENLVEVRGVSTPTQRTRFPFEATINGRPFFVDRFIGAILILSREE